MNFYRDYQFDLNRLSQSEKDAVVLMKKMLVITGDIYNLQLDKSFAGSNFYPKDTNKDELIAASLNDSSILDPYTVVKRDPSGALFSVPFHKEYEQYLKQISDLAIEASNLDIEPQVKDYLKQLSKACSDDSWEDLENFWLKVEGNKLDFQLAPIESYLDGMMSIKHAFQGTIRFSSERSDFNPERYIETVKAIKLTNIESVDTLKSNTSVRVDDLIAASGHQYVVPARGSNYPNDINKVADFGTKIIVYTDNIIRREKESLIPTLKRILDQETLSQFSDEDLFGAGIRNVLAHEIAEGYIKYPDTVKRLKNMYFPIRELHSSLIGLKIASHHVLQGALSHRGYESMLLTLFIGRAFSDTLRNENPANTSRGLTYYVRGYVAAFNYFLMNNAATITSDKFLTVDFPKVFACLDQLSQEIGDIKREGTEVTANEFFKKYEHYEFIDAFRDRLKDINY